MQSSRTLLFIGCGNMGAAIASGALRQMPDTRVVALDPDPERARSLLPSGSLVAIHKDAAQLLELRPDLIILGVKPQTFSALGSDVLELLRIAPVVSIMAGVKLSSLTTVLAPSTVVRVMPNLPALVGQAMSLGCAPPSLPPAVASTIEALFSAAGQFTWAADEELFEKANAVFASGPGFIFAFAEQMILAAVGMGLPQDLAASLVHQTIFGSAKMLTLDPRGAEGLKHAVSSPGGTTLAGLSILEAESSGLPKLLPETFAATHARALELAGMRTPE